ncbi:MAG TPA: 2-dehydropantoate 2-reductase N-terminal domain-containing protein, partial [Stellaceae bacterium]
MSLDRPRFLVLGAGAVGGYFGGRLAAAKADVTFLVRPARAAALSERGLVIESPMGDLRLPVRVATADTLNGFVDTVLLTAKAYDLEQAIAT